MFALNEPAVELQRQIAIQSASYHNSASHQAIRDNRESRHYNVGDTHSFWRWNLSVMPPTWIQTPATCRAVGEHCYLFVADSDWNTHMTQANVDTVMVRLEQRTVNDPTKGLIQMDIDEFGPIPNELDNDPKLIVFYSALGSFQGTSFDGYFSAYNEVTEAQAQQMNPAGHSNECEMIYMTCYPLNPVAPVRLSVLAHELCHMIHWGFDQSEATWVDEGLAELAMVKYGVPDPITGFNSNPDLDLTAWTQSTSDYVKVMLFFTYLAEHYDQDHLIRDIMEDPENGMTSIANQVSSHIQDMTISDVFRDWTIANYIDKPTPDSALYNYSELTLPTFTLSYHYAQEFTNVSNITGTTQPWATDYIKIDQNQWYHHMAIQGNHPFYLSTIAIPTNTSDPWSVNPSETFDNFEWLNYYWAGAYVLVISNPSDTQLSYSFSLVTGDGVDDDVSTPVLSPQLICYPNPFISNASSMKIEVKNAANGQGAKADIFNIKGQLVSSVSLSKDDKGSLSSNWSGRNESGEAMPSGVYFVKYSDGSKSLNRKIVIIR